MSFGGSSTFAVAIAWSNKLYARDSDTHRVLAIVSDDALRNLAVEAIGKLFDRRHFARHQQTLRIPAQRALRVINDLAVLQRALFHAECVAEWLISQLSSKVSHVCLFERLCCCLATVRQHPFFPPFFGGFIGIGLDLAMEFLLCNIP